MFSLKAFLTKTITLLVSLVLIISCSSPQKTNNEESKESPEILLDQKQSLYYQKFGSGDPIIVLHGGPGMMDHSYLLPQMLELAKDHQLIFYDQRGSGKSMDTVVTHENINVKQFIDDLDTLRKHLGLQSFTLLGHSWGGLLAMNYVLEHPEQVSSLILLNTSPADKEERKNFVEVLKGRLESIQEQVAPLYKYSEIVKLTANEISDLYRLLFSVYLYNPEDAQKITLNMTEEAAKKGYRTEEIMVQNTFGTNLLEKLKDVKTSTLIIRGDYDVVPQAAADKIHDAMPNSTLVNISECGHFSFIEKPDEVFHEIREFLKLSISNTTN